MCYCRPEIRTPYCSQCPQKMHDEIERLRKELDAAKKDSERYRWIRMCRRGVDIVFDGGMMPDKVLYGRKLDRYIDAAMKEST